MLVTVELYTYSITYILKSWFFLLKEKRFLFTFLTGHWCILSLSYFYSVCSVLAESIPLTSISTLWRTCSHEIAYFFISCLSCNLFLFIHSFITHCRLIHSLGIISWAQTFYARFFHRRRRVASDGMVAFILVRFTSLSFLALYIVCRSVGWVVDQS